MEFFYPRITVLMYADHPELFQRINWDFKWVNYNDLTHLLLEEYDFTDERHIDSYLSILKSNNSLNSESIILLLDACASLHKSPEDFIDINTQGYYDVDRTKAIENIKKCIISLQNYGFVCFELFKLLATKEREHSIMTDYTLIADGILATCHDADWSWLENYIPTLHSKKFTAWWENRQDI